MKCLILLLIFTNISIAQQTCRTESDIPNSTPNSIFIDNLNNTITDIRYGLMWKKCQIGLSGNNCESGFDTTFTWKQALDEAEASDHAGYNDWRLPNLKELLSIVELSCFNPSININYFPNTSSSGFWTESPFINFSNRAWSVLFQSGDANKNDSREFGYFVRLVRTQL